MCILQMLFTVAMYSIEWSENDTDQWIGSSIYPSDTTVLGSTLTGTLNAKTILYFLVYDDPCSMYHSCHDGVCSISFEPFHFRDIWLRWFLSRVWLEVSFFYQAIPEMFRVMFDKHSHAIKHVDDHLCQTGVSAGKAALCIRSISENSIFVQRLGCYCAIVCIPYTGNTYCVVLCSVLHYTVWHASRPASWPDWWILSNSASNRETFTQTFLFLSIARECLWWLLRQNKLLHSIYEHTLVEGC